MRHKIFNFLDELGTFRRNVIIVLKKPFQMLRISSLSRVSSNRSTLRMVRITSVLFHTLKNVLTHYWQLQNTDNRGIFEESGAEWFTFRETADIFFVEAWETTIWEPLNWFTTWLRESLPQKPSSFLSARTSGIFSHTCVTSLRFV